MLHSLRYYACYYALICLLYQQQRVASLTIIIDGATTSEWETRDEYRRMLEGADGGGGDSDASDLFAGQRPFTSHQRAQYEADVKLRRLVTRASKAERFCGDLLHPAIEKACNGSFNPGQETEPETVEPIIKTKRAVRQRALSSYHHHPPAMQKQQQQQQEQQQQEQEQQQLQQQLLLRALESDIYLDGGISASDLAGEREQHSTIKHAGTNIDSDDTNMDNNDGEYNINPLINKSRRRYNRMVSARRARSITNECCKNACTVETLRSYCKI